MDNNNSQGSTAQEESCSRTAKIIALHNEITAQAHSCLEKAISIGELLHQERRRLTPHAWWLWLDSDLRITEKTAQKYLRCYDRREELRRECL